ncbi:SSI family serine proteinase inhibitor [Streptomyces sp. NRRL S-87]|uniref:SSI family serine proteinase inhibitor n=1 Tax=Streptomyces sp. NRRL S-87 TaxID=1463920 RepID=UPI0004C29534|nr:SSI family serine proteinase inhibitor [Streptomyces sp. NRRL S-87]
MRSIVRGLGLAATTMALTAATAVTAVGTADAAPTGEARLYAPSALVISLVDGVDPSEGIIRAVTLSCMPTPTGTHPDPAGACGELRANNAKFDQITKAGSAALCTREWHPMTVTVDGVWEGSRVSYRHTFANRCALHNGSGTVFGI